MPTTKSNAHIPKMFADLKLMAVESVIHELVYATSSPITKHATHVGNFISVASFCDFELSKTMMMMMMTSGERCATNTTEQPAVNAAPEM